MAIITYCALYATTRTGELRDLLPDGEPYLDFGSGHRWATNPKLAKECALDVWRYVEVKWDTEKEEVVP